MNELARLVFPALRYRSDSGFHHESRAIDDALAEGVGGFCIFGGTPAGVRELTEELRSRSRTPLLFASDLERGAGQQFAGATQLPPLAALGWLDDREVTRRAASITAREAVTAGVDWIYAPVADVDLEPRNPIVGTRAFGGDALHVARHVAAWVEGCRSAGALCCAKHFPGHGRTVDDSHARLPRVGASRHDLDTDLLPFRAAIAAGVDSMMTAHVIYAALDDTTAATFSPHVATALARQELGFAGLLVTDALNMAGSLEASGGSEGTAAVAALQAGCDALLYPDDVPAVLRALEHARNGIIPEQRWREALLRLSAAVRRRYAADAAAARTRDDAVYGVIDSVADGGGLVEDAAWADGIAERCLVVSRGEPRIAGSCRVAILDDDTGGPFPPPGRSPFTDTLAGSGRLLDSADGAQPVIAVFSDIRAWKGRPGLRAEARSGLEALLARDPDAIVVFFGHPRLAQELPGRHILAAWGGEAIMQSAAARWLTRSQGS